MHAVHRWFLQMLFDPRLSLEFVSIRHQKLILSSKSFTWALTVQLLFRLFIWTFGLTSLGSGKNWTLPHKANSIRNGNYTPILSLLTSYSIEFESLAVTDLYTMIWYKISNIERPLRMQMKVMEILTVNFLRFHVKEATHLSLSISSSLVFSLDHFLYEN